MSRTPATVVEIASQVPPERPWQRQPNESIQPYTAFEVYRDMGEERSVHKVSRQLSKSVTLIKRWSAAHHWLYRVRRFESYLSDLDLKQREKERAEMNGRHIKMAHEVMAKLVERIEALQAKEVTVGNLGRLFELCLKVERLAMGEPTENVHAAHEGVENGAPIRHAILSKVIILPPNGRDPVT